ncbi:hypothetical protein AKO1_006330, partial [Acrasis kona]
MSEHTQKRKRDGGDKQNKRFKKQRQLHEFNSIKGLLFTVRTDREREAKHEAVAMIDEVVEDMIENLPEEEKPVQSLSEETKNEETPTTSADAPVDQSAKLKEELAAMGDGDNVQILDTCVRGIIFIRITHPRISPNDVAKKLIENMLADESNVKTRFLYKMFPILTTCYCTEENVLAKTKEVVGAYFDKFSGASPQSYQVFHKQLFSDALSKQKALDIISKSIKYYHFADLKKPNVAVILYIVKSVCCVGVIDKYHEMKEYNINKVRSHHEGKGKDVDTNQVKPITNVKEASATAVKPDQADAITNVQVQETSTTAAPTNQQNEPNQSAAADLIKEEVKSDVTTSQQDTNVKVAPKQEGKKKKKKGGPQVGG